MYCDRCGNQILEGQRFCSSCGKPAGIVVMSPAPESRVARHLNLLGVLWLAASALNLILAFMIFLTGNMVFGRVVNIEGLYGIQGFLRGMMSAVATLVLLKALAGIIAGWGLLQREPWARLLTLVLGFISLLSIPFGTALGIYTIWVLLSPQAEQEYRQLSRAA